MIRQRKDRDGHQVQVYAGHEAAACREKAEGLRAKYGL
jgi:hypothetical protein